MVSTIKFSQMTSGGNIGNNNEIPGLLSGGNVLFNVPWTFLPPGSTATRPVPVPAIYNLLRFNTDLFVYEYYDSNTATWTELSGSGTGTVNPGSVNDLAFYASSGTTVSPLLTAANSVLVTSPGSVPSLSTTLPSGLSIPGATITSSTAALTAGSVVAAPVAGSDMVNKTYADGLYTASVHSITGTTNQIIASSPTGDVTLSLPQDIDTGSNVQFGTVQLNSSPSAIRDLNSNIMLAFFPTASAVNYIQITNNALGFPPQLAAIGSDTDIPINITSKGAAPVRIVGGNTTAGFDVYNGTAAQHRTSFVFANTSASRTATFQDSSGTVAWLTDIPSVTPSAMTSANDTNVTISLGGTPATSLLQAVSLTMGWTGQLSETRGGTHQSTYTLGDTLYSSAANTLAKLTGNITTTKQYLSQTGTGTVSAAPVWATISGSDITGAALTKTDDTNVTLTLGGTPTTALLRATSLTLGWTGSLSVSRGGTGNSSLTANTLLTGGTTSTGALQQVSAGTSGFPLISQGSSAIPVFSSTPTITQILDVNGNAILILNPNVSSVNVISLSNAATGTGPGITVTGTDTNIALGISGKGNSGVKVQGSADNTNAAVGYVREYFSQNVGSGSATSLTTATPVTIATISPTAGDWDVQGAIAFTIASTTSVSNLQCSISTSNNTMATVSDTSSVAIQAFAANVPGTSTYILNLASCRKLLSSTTPLYVVCQASFTISTISAYGWISARRR